MSELNTNMNYVGEVTLTYIVNGKKLKVKKYNKGWSRLFYFIARCLGDAQNPGTIMVERPQLLDIKCRHEGGNWESGLYSYVPVTPSYSYVTDNSMTDYGGLNYYATFTATISFNTVNTTFLQQYTNQTDSCALFLMSGSTTPYTPANDSAYRMAQLLLDVASLATIDPGTQVIVEWNMKFSNKEVS